MHKLRAMFACLLLGTLAMAQEYRGRVQGVVTDATGAAAPEQPWSYANLGTNVDSTRTTNETGRYIFDYVDPGTYSLTAELSGFKKLIQQNILVQQRGDVTVDLKMEMGTVSEIDHGRHQRRARWKSIPPPAI